MVFTPLLWRHNEPDGVSNHQPHDCLLNRLLGNRSKKTSKLRVTGLCAGNSPETGEFPAQMASNAENVSIWWRHRAKGSLGSHSGETEFPWFLIFVDRTKSQRPVAYSVYIEDAEPSFKNYLPQGKMAAISKTIFSDAIFVNEKLIFW